MFSCSKMYLVKKDSLTFHTKIHHSLKTAFRKEEGFRTKMKMVIWELPKKQTDYIIENCKEQFLSGEIHIMEPETAKSVLAEISSGKQSVKEILMISENPKILAEAAGAGMAVAAYQEPGTFGEMEFPPVDMVVEGFEEIDYEFLKRIYQRHHRIPWTILETERLIVRELDLKDLDDLFELYSYDGMTDYMEKLFPYEEEYQYQKAYIENMYRFFGYGMWLVFEKESGKLVGRAGVEHREELDGELELGYAIGKPFWGRGYATEVCQAILNYVREELGFEEISGLVEPENKISVYLLEKLGFSLEKELVLEGRYYKKYKKTF